MNDFPRWPQLEAEDLQAAQDVLRSFQLSQLSSPAVEEFEEAFASYHASTRCVAVSSGTAAVHAALVALDIGPGDQVIVPSHTFIASASPILFQGAEPVFADVDDRTYCLSMESLEALVTPRTKAIVAVHLNGHPAPMGPILALAERNGIQVVEDVAQAIGGSYEGRKLGTLGRVACFSFWESKIITTGGEGGAVLTSDDALASRLERIRQHGEVLSHQTRLYSSRELGYNYRLTAMQAAIGKSQLGRLDAYVAARRHNAELLTAGLREVQGLQVPTEAEGAAHAYWKYVCRVRPEMLRAPIGTIVDELQAAGVPAFRRYPVPLHRQPVFEELGYGGQACPVADRLPEELFSLPVHPALRRDHVDYTIAKVRDVVEAHLA